MEESIYNLIPKEAAVQGEEGSKTLYKSIFYDQAHQESNQGKSPGRNMGPPGGTHVSPKSFLRTGAGITLKESIIPPHTKRDFTSTKPPVPRHDERPVIAGPTTKNFVQDNLRHIAVGHAAQPVPAYVDVPNGRGGRFPLETSGLVPKYTKLPTYGQLPEYLSRRKGEEQTQRTLAVTMAAQDSVKTGLRQMPEAERLELLAGLRANWSAVHHEYQGISVITDTIPKRTLKANLETRLAELEGDIARIESHRVIYVESA